LHAVSELDHVWVQIAEALRERVGERTFERWLAPLRCVGRDRGTLALEGPREVSAWAAARLGPAIAEAAAARLGRDLAVTINGRALAGAAATSPSTPPARGDGPRLNPRYTFDQFVIGPSNRLAHAAALSVAEMPSQAYNPLFIYGPPGLGKTHLLHSVGNYVNSFGGGLTVRYATAEEFTNGFLAALRSRSIDDFKARFRGVDVLLVDDVQFLERKARSEEELFHTFNALYDAGGQLVITCDRLPGDLGELEDRLRERFAAGLVTDIERPDLATRLAIVRKRALHDGVALPTDAAQLLAERVTSNVRALEGALIRLVAYGSLTGHALDGALAGAVVDRLGIAAAEACRPLSIRAIQDAACLHFGLTPDELLSRSRTARIVWARQAAMYLAKELTNHSLPLIGEQFGGRDHTTVMHACRRVVERIAASRDAFNDIEMLTALVTASRSQT
jgi:chromosomal replication initiator protein